MTTGAAATRKEPAGVTPPAGSALERARKVLLHEQRLGCLDRAVVGGLEHFMLQLGAGVPPELPAGVWLRAAARQLAGYAQRPPGERRAVIEHLLGQLHRLERAEGDSRPSAAVAATGTDRPSAAVAATGTSAVAKPAGAPGVSGARRPPPATAKHERVAAPSPLAPVTALPGVGPKAAAALEKLEY